MRTIKLEVKMVAENGKEEAEARSIISKGRRDRWDADHGKEHEV